MNNPQNVKFKHNANRVYKCFIILVSYIFREIYTQKSRRIYVVIICLQTANINFIRIIKSLLHELWMILKWKGIIRSFSFWYKRSSVFML